MGQQLATFRQMRFPSAQLDRQHRHSLVPQCECSVQAPQNELCANSGRGVNPPCAGGALRSIFGSAENRIGIASCAEPAPVPAMTNPPTSNRPANLDLHIDASLECNAKPDPGTETGIGMQRQPSTI